MHLLSAAPVRYQRARRAKRVGNGSRRRHAFLSLWQHCVDRRCRRSRKAFRTATAGSKPSVRQLAGEKVPDQIGNFAVMRFECEMLRVEQMDLRLWEVLSIRLRSRRDEC